MNAAARLCVAPVDVLLGEEVRDRNLRFYTVRIGVFLGVVYGNSSRFYTARIGVLALFEHARRVGNKTDWQFSGSIGFPLWGMVDGATGPCGISTGRYSQMERIMAKHKDKR